MELGTKEFNDSAMEMFGGKPKQQTSVEFLEEAISIHFTFEQKMQFEGLFQQAKEMEKQQIIDAGNSCAFKQRLHSDRINKMSMDELEQYNLEPSYSFGEEHYYETFNK